GGRLLTDKLKRDNYEVQGLVFDKEPPKKGEPNIVLAPEGENKKRKVPDDCYALVIAGASRPLPPETMEALEQFFDRGGKMMICLDIVIDPQSKAPRFSGIESFLKKYGIKSANEFVVRQPLAERDDSQTSFATAVASNHILAKQFTGFEMPFRTPVAIRPDE